MHLHFNYVLLPTRRMYRHIVFLIVIILLYCTYLYLVLWGHIRSFSDLFDLLVIFLKEFSICILISTSITVDVEPHSLSHFDHIVILNIPIPSLMDSH